MPGKSMGSWPTGWRSSPAEVAASFVASAWFGPMKKGRFMPRPGRKSNRKIVTLEDGTIVPLFLQELDPLPPWQTPVDIGAACRCLQDRLDECRHADMFNMAVGWIDELWKAARHVQAEAVLPACPAISTVECGRWQPDDTLFRDVLGALDVLHGWAVAEKKAQPDAVQPEAGGQIDDESVDDEKKAHPSKPKRKRRKIPPGRVERKREREERWIREQEIHDLWKSGQWRTINDLLAFILEKSSQGEKSLRLYDIKRAIANVNRRSHKKK